MRGFGMDEGIRDGQRGSKTTVVLAGGRVDQIRQGGRHICAPLSRPAHTKPEARSRDLETGEKGRPRPNREPPGIGTG